MKYQFNDGGRSNSKRPKQKNDCTVRALVIATDMKYDEVYDLLKDAGRKASKGFQLGEWLSTVDTVSILGRKFNVMTFPAVKGQRRMNPEAFSERFPKGVFICKTAKHVFAVIDGVQYDTFQERPDRCIYKAWKVE